MSRDYPVHIVAVGGLVTNIKDQVLMIKSPRYDDWEFPGGQVEESETLTHALEREILEETGIVVKVMTLVGIYSNVQMPSIVNIDFICEYISGKPKTSAESLQVEWVNRKDALPRIKREVIYKRMKDMLEFSGEVIYRAYLVDANQAASQYSEVEDRKI